jgi:NitT/TauT family transport system permease protein
MKIQRFPHHHHRPLYETTARRLLGSTGIAALVLLGFAALLIHVYHPQNRFNINLISWHDIAIGTINSFFRMFLSYCLSLLFAVPLSLFMASTPGRQRILLPIADVLQSIPVLAFFPVVALFFVNNNEFEAAALFIIFLQMAWNIVFPVVGGLQTIPDDVTSAALVFNVRGWRKFLYITLPALFPFIVTGSLLAWAQGWTTVIVAEVLHTYIPNGTMSQDLLGLGSLLVDSNAAGKSDVFLATLGAMILLITVMNFLVWQPLIQLSQRFRFD